MSYDAYTDPLNTITDWPMTSQKLATALLGPLMAGWIAHLILFGLVQSQFFAYTSSALYSRDPPRTKLLLWSVVGLDFVTSFLNAEQMFHYGTNEHRDFASLYVTRPIDSAGNLLCGVIAMTVQLFLLKRASSLFNHNMLHRWIFVGSISFLSVMSFLAACGSFTVGVMWGYGKVEEALPFTYNNLTSTWLMSSLAVDCALCFTLVSLLRARYDTRTKGSPVRRLISTTIQSAALTAIFGLVGAIISCFPQSNNMTANVPLFWVTPLPSLYALALVTTLSARSSRAPALVTGTILNVGDIISPSGTCGGAPAFARASEKSRAAVEDDDEDEGEDEKGALEPESPQLNLRMEPAFAGLQTTRRAIPRDFELSTMASESGGASEVDNPRIQWA